MSEFTHLDNQGRVRMADVSDKQSTARAALAQGMIFMKPDTLEKILDQTVKKGNVLETARIAGIMAAKKTSELIPLCHPLCISHIGIEFIPEIEKNAIRIAVSVKITDRTGIEMEALTAVAIAALTIYDMCKSYDREMVISGICLLEKSGGKSGTFVREDSI